MASNVLKQCSCLTCHVRNAQETLTAKCPVPNTKRRSAESQNVGGLNCHVVRRKSYVCLRVYSRKYFYEFCSELLVFIELLGKIREQISAQRTMHVGKTLCCCVVTRKIRHVYFISATTLATVTTRPDATDTTAWR